MAQWSHLEKVIVAYRDGTMKGTIPVMSTEHFLTKCHISLCCDHQCNSLQGS